MKICALQGEDAIHENMINKNGKHENWCIKRGRDKKYYDQ